MTKALPIRVLSESLDANFETGEVTWLTRPRSHFLTDRGFNLFNSRFAGRPAITSKTKQGFEGGIAFQGEVYHLQRSRVIWALSAGAWPTFFVGTRNGDCFDTRLANLREHTKSQQQCFARYRNRTGARGVQQVPSGNFRAEIMLAGKRMHLGTYATLNQARDARDKAAIRLHGAFARLSRSDTGARHG